MEGGGGGGRGGSRCHKTGCRSVVKLVYCILPQYFVHRRWLIRIVSSKRNNNKCSRTSSAEERCGLKDFTIFSIVVGKLDYGFC